MHKLLKRRQWDVLVLVMACVTVVVKAVSIHAPVPVKTVVQVASTLVAEHVVIVAKEPASIPVGNNPLIRVTRK